MNFNVSKPIARLIWPRIKREFVNVACRCICPRTELGSQGNPLGHLPLGETQAFQETLWGCRSKLGPYRRRKRFARQELDGPFDGEVATRLKAKNTFASKSHAFSYVSSPFDLNDRNDNPFVGIDAFCNNVSSLEKQRAFLADEGLDLGR